MRYLQYKRFAALMALTASFGLPLLAQAPAKAPAAAGTKAAEPGVTAAAPAAPRRPRFNITGVGTEPTTEDMGNVAWVTGPSGKGLPDGSGTAKQGAQIFMVKCSMCHGVDGRGVHWAPGKFSPIAGPPLWLPRKAGDGPHPDLEKSPPHDPWIPPLTSGAPFPEPIFNTIAVEMPMYRPGTLTANEVYALTAWVYFKNGYIGEDDVLDKNTLPKIKMPNAKYFPKSDDVYMDLNKRGCYKTYGTCVGNDAGD